MKLTLKDLKKLVKNVPLEDTELYTKLNTMIYDETYRLEREKQEEKLRFIKECFDRINEMVDFNKKKKTLQELIIRNSLISSIEKIERDSVDKIAINILLDEGTEIKQLKEVVDFVDNNKDKYILNITQL